MSILFLKKIKNMNGIFSAVHIFADKPYFAVQFILVFDIIIAASILFKSDDMTFDVMLSVSAFETAAAIKPSGYFASGDAMPHTTVMIFNACSIVILLSGAKLLFPIPFIAPASTHAFIYFAAQWFAASLNVQFSSAV